MPTLNPELANRTLKYYNMDYGLISKLNLEEELSQNSWLEGQQKKKQASDKKVFVASENCVTPIKTAVEVKADLKTEHLTKLKIDNKNIPDSFKILHVWMNKQTFLIIYCFFLQSF